MPDRNAFRRFTEPIDFVQSSRHSGVWLTEPKFPPIVTAERKDSAQQLGATQTTRPSMWLVPQLVHPAFRDDTPRRVTRPIMRSYLYENVFVINQLQIKLRIMEETFYWRKQRILRVF
jgi:hypothetical protein